MEKALRESQEQLSLAMESAALGLFDIDLVQRCAHWSARMCEIHGIADPLEAMPLERLAGFLLPEDRATVHDAVARASDPAGDGRYDLEHRIVRPDGTLRWVHPFGRAQFAVGEDGARRAVRLVGVTQDITAQRQAADRLRQVTTLLQAVSDATPTFLYLKDAAGRLLYCNAAVLDLLGKPAEAVIGRTAAEHLGPGPRTDALVAHDLEAMRTDRTVIAEERLPGTDRVFLSTKTPYRDAGGRVIGVAGVSVDMTEQRRLQAALRDSEERLRLAVESSSLGTFDFDPRAAVVALSAPGAHFYGLAGECTVPLDELFGRMHPEDRTPMAALVARMLADDGEDEYSYQHRIVQPDGAVRWLDARARVHFAPDEAGTPRATRVLGVLWDITEHQQLVDSLRQADRAKDEFLAMLAHELRNPLAPLTNALKLLERDAPLAASHRRALAIAQRQTAQLTRLVDDLLEVSRITRGKIELRCEPTLVAAAVYNAAESVAGAIEARGQRLHVALPSATGRIRADPARLAQVLENLLTNASKYTPDGGTIRVEVEEDAHAVVIRVADDGIGIEPDKLAQVFELFAQIDATLDRAQGGLGIGLALVRRLVALHGGSVTAESAGRGRGATFTVRLPRGGPAAEAPGT